MEEELKRILQSAENPIEIEDDFSSLNKEFILFKNTKKRTDNLNKHMILYPHLQGEDTRWGATLLIKFCRMIVYHHSINMPKR